MTTQQFLVPEISCQHCVNAITKEVSELSDVQNVEVSIDAKTVTVAHGEQVNTDAIVAAIQEAGFDEVTQVQG